MKSFNLNKPCPKNIQQENEMSFSMLNEIISNKKIRNVLKIISKKIKDHILHPILEALQKECDARILRSEVGQKEQRAITYGISNEA